MDRELTQFIRTAYSLLTAQKATAYKLGDWVECEDKICKVESIYTQGIRNDFGDDYEATKENPVYLLRVMQDEQEGTNFTPTSITMFAYETGLAKYEGVKQKALNAYEFDTCAFIKQANGELVTYGIYSSHYIDSDDDILTSKAHADFAVGVNSGQYTYPDIYIAHVPLAVGKTDMIDYHTDGFAVFGGRIFKSWANDVEQIIRNSKAQNIQLGLSHGFYNTTVEYDEEGWISKYISHEISILPLYPAIIDGRRTTSASNKYTALLSTEV